MLWKGANSETFSLFNEEQTSVQTLCRNQIENHTHYLLFGMEILQIKGFDVGRGEMRGSYLREQSQERRESKELKRRL